jgi:hypothetical protein
MYTVLSMGSSSSIEYRATQSVVGYLFCSCSIDVRFRRILKVDFKNRIIGTEEILREREQTIIK